MLRSKKDVDRHVRDILNKVKSESERKLRGYNIARFYHNVGEYELARRYLSEFLSVRPKAIDGHRLLGQIYEASGNKEKAVLAYKTAYELGDGQRDLVIKICELYSVVSCDASVRVYWAEEGQRLCPHHESVTKLRTAIITRSADTSSRHSLQQLYLDEIKVNPTSAELQSNLVRLYLDWCKDEPRKLDEAYNYVAEVEARRPFTHSLTWYQTMLEVAEAYEKRGSPQCAGAEFHTSYITGLERLVHLTLEAASTNTATSDSNKTHAPYLTEAANLLLRFDGKLSILSRVNNDRELERAMLGQLFFHIAQYLIITAKKSSSPLSPNTLSCLLLHACRFPPPSAAADGSTTSGSYYHRLACYRLSQSCHILHNIARDTNTTVTSMVNKVRQQCSNRETKDEVFRIVFGGRVATEHSYFLHHSGFVDADLSLPSSDALTDYDQVVSVSECSQLREIVWLCLQEILSSSNSLTSVATNNSLNLSNLNTSLNSSNITSSSNNLNAIVKSVLKKSQPYYPYKLFEGLQFATSHLTSAVPDSLCHLDLLAFLAATLYCQLETGVCSSNVRSAVCKTSVCSGWLLHTEQQGEWWTAAHNLYLNSTRRSALAKGVGKSRQVVQRGLDAVRLLSGGGVSLPLSLHLAQCFTHWASSALDGGSSSVSISEVTALEERAEHCWQQVLALCGKGDATAGTATTHTPRNKIFVTNRHDLPAGELESVDEEGRLFLALRLKKAGRRQEALQALGQLKSPDAAFHRAMVYKHQANELLSAVSGDLSLFTPEQRGQHTLMLTQARDTLYLTLDRLRMPGVDRNHPLNAALSQELTTVERYLTSITIDDSHLNSSYAHDGEDSVVEPLSPIRRAHDLTNGHDVSLDATPAATPLRDNRATSTFRRLEARPSPERLDAQVRHLTSVQEQTLQNLCEQNAALRSHNSALRDTCNTMAGQVKENTELFRTILEQNKTISMDCYNNILTEIKMLQPSIKSLQEEMQKLKIDIAEVKIMKGKKGEESDAHTALEHLSGRPTPPPAQQGVLPGLYMGYYGNQVASPHLPPPRPPPRVPPPSSLFGGHHHPTHQPPFLPPATLADLALLANSNGQRAGVGLEAISGTSSSSAVAAAAAAAAISSSGSSRPPLPPQSHHQQQLLAQHLQHHEASAAVMAAQQQMQQEAAAAHYAAVAAAAAAAQQGEAVADAAAEAVQGSTSAVTGSLLSGGGGVVGGFSGLMPAAPALDMRTGRAAGGEKSAAAAAIHSSVAPTAMNNIAMAAAAAAAAGMISSAPHNYQIPLPATLLSSVTPPRHHTPERSAGSLISTTGLLASVPAPLYSAVTPDSSPVRPQTAVVVVAPPVPTATITPRFPAPGSSTPSGGTILQQQLIMSSAAATPPPPPPVAVALPAAVTVASAPATPLTGKVKTFPQRSQLLDELTDSILDTSGVVEKTPSSVVAPANLSNDYYPDDDHDPCPDFKPVVPLPEKVDVCTGEEDEQVLFEDRAKLYRMVAKEWKERGTGVLKILHHCTKKSLRILMRRDQTLKICANHSISAEMELKKQQKSDNVWVWGAQDFADEELRVETFCGKFKTAEIAHKFSRAFTEATRLSLDYEKDVAATGAVIPPAAGSSSAAVTTASSTMPALSTLFKKAPGSWSCDTCLVSNTPDASACAACQTPNPNAASVAPTAANTKASSDFASAAGNFQFGVAACNAAASSSISFSALPPAKPSGSITFGVSGQAGSKASLFSTPTGPSTGMFSTYSSTASSSSGQFLSAGLTSTTPASQQGLFSTPTTASTKAAIFSTPTTFAPSASAAAVTPGGFSTPTATSGFSSSLFGTPQQTSSIFGTPAVDLSATITSSAANKTPNVSSSFVFSSNTSSLFGTATTAVAASTTTSSSIAPTADDGKIAFGGFSFTTTPSIVPASDKLKEQEPKKEEEKKDSIFSSFTFASGTGNSFSKDDGTFKSDSSKASTGGVLFSSVGMGDTLTFGAVAGSSPAEPKDVFKTKDEEAFKPKPFFMGGNRSANTTAAADESSERVEEYEPEVHFEPVIPLPELIQVKTGEEEEQVLFCDRAKLFRWADPTKEWKERGLGDVKILSNATTGKLRLLMRREKTHKICINHYITPDLKMAIKADSDKALTWAANDFSEGEVVNEKFTIKFKNPQLANAFKRTFEKARETAEINAQVTPDSTSIQVSSSDTIDSKPLQSLADKFRPAAGSWECSTCLLRNKAEDDNCLSCQSAKPGAVTAAISKITDSVTITPVPLDDKTKSLAALFKPATGSWECDICLVRNNPDVVICVSCQTLKTGCVAPEASNKESSSDFGAQSSAFSFGVGTTSAVITSAAAPASSVFSASAFKFGASGSGPSATFSFGLPPSSKSEQMTTMSTSFTFKPPMSSKESSKESSVSKSPPLSAKPDDFKFGSPEKFEFSFNPKSPRSRDVSQCESEDGLAEEDDGDHLYFEPVVPLPEKVDVITGEEQEDVLYSHRAKLFRKAGPEWKERGLGDVKVLRHRQTRRVRLLMRREQVHKICLNHYLTKDIEFMDKDDKSFYWVAQDYSEDTPTRETLAIRFKTSDIAQEFKKVAIQAQDSTSSVDAGSSPVTTSATVGSGASTPATTSRDGSVDTTSKAESSKLERARKLLLPDDFFNYETSEVQCAGCIGCREDSPAPFLELVTPPGNVLKDFPCESSDPSSSSAKPVFGSSVGKPLFGSETSGESTATLSFGSAPSIFGGATSKATTVTDSGNSSGVARVFSAADKTATSSLFGGTSVRSLFGTPSSTSQSDGAEQKPSSLFGKDASSASVFGATTTTTTKSSIFGGSPAPSASYGAAPATTASAFGGASSMGGSVFGGATSTAGSVFGGATSTAGSVFGGASTGRSVFGGASAAGSVFAGSSAGSSVFGGASTAGSVFGREPSTPISTFGGGAAAGGSIFGGSTPTTGSIFGGVTSKSSETSVFGGASVFGGGTSSTNSLLGSAPSASVFGSDKIKSSFISTPTAPLTNTAATSLTFEESAKAKALFSSPVTGAATSGSVFSGAPGSLFGGATANAETNKDLISFSDFASTRESTCFNSKSGADSPAWVAKPIFSSHNTSNRQNKDDSGVDQLHQEDDSHDPHFEPVIPMPDLVEVKTGEEGLEVVYSHRAKTFRYDNSTKEWKERGLGDIKILYDPINQKYRLLQRREQIHKLAVHHYILPDQKLNPMALSESAFCWYAQDFSEDSQGTQEQLAAKFKTTEIAKEFKNKFEKCVANAGQTSSVNTSAVQEPQKQPQQQEVSSSAATPSTHSNQENQQQTLVQPYASESETETDDDEDDEDDDYVDSSIMYEKMCNLEKRLGEDWVDMGLVTVRVLYESDADGARLMATDDRGILLADHLITKDMFYSMDDGEECISWSAMDLSTQPACQVKLRASFLEPDHKEDFCCTFEEGRELVDRDDHHPYEED